MMLEVFTLVMLLSISFVKVLHFSGRCFWSLVRAWAGVVGLVIVFKFSSSLCLRILECIPIVLSSPRVDVDMFCLFPATSLLFWLAEGQAGADRGCYN